MERESKKRNGGRERLKRGREGGERGEGERG